MSTSKVIAGVVALIILAVGGYFLFRSPAAIPYASTATSTLAGGGTGIPNTGGESPDVPSVSTDPNVYPTNSAAIVSGTITPNGAQTTYWFDYGTSINLGSRTPSESIGSGYTALTAPGVITGLSPSTTYYYRLHAENSFGNASGTVYSFSTNTTASPKIILPGVRTTSATSVARTSATLNGSITPNGVDATVWFEYGESTALGQVSSFSSMGADANSADGSLEVDNLKPLTKYYFRLDAENQYGSVQGQILSFTTLGPPETGAPTAATLSATNIAPTAATLRGTVVPNGEATTYWFEYGTDSNLGTLVGTTTLMKTAGAGYALSAITTRVMGLSASTTYYYRFLAANESGTSTGDTLTFHTPK